MKNVNVRKHSHAHDSVDCWERTLIPFVYELVVAEIAILFSQREERQQSKDRC